MVSFSKQEKEQVNLCFYEINCMFPTLFLKISPNIWEYNNVSCFNLAHVVQNYLNLLQN